MTIRYWAMATFMIVGVLWLPGVVFANGNGHHAHGSHQKNHAQGPPQQPKTHGKSGESHLNGSDHKNQSHENQDKDHSKKSHNPSRKQHSQGADHANVHAKQHAADQSAVHETANDVNVKDKTSTQQKHHKKAKSQTATVHNDAKQDLEHQVQIKPGSKDPERESSNPLEEKNTQQVHHPTVKIKKVVAKQRTENPKSPTKHRRSKNGPSKPTHPPEPMGVISLSPTVPGSNDHSKSRTGLGLAGKTTGIGIVPDRLHSAMFSVQSFIARRVQYGNQWINAPPSPPPKNLLLFSA